MIINKSRYILLLLLITLIAFNYSLGFAETAEKDFNKTISFIEGGTIDIGSVNGSITIDSWDKKDVDIKAKLKVKGEYADEIIDEVKIKTEIEGSTLSIGVDYPDFDDVSFWDIIRGRRKPRISVSFRFKVPRISNIDAHSTNGGIKINDIEGSVLSRSTNGSIEANKIVGDTELKTTNGRISTFDIIGNVKAKTTNGSINLDNNTGSVEARTTNGSISAEILKLEKDVICRTTNGSVNVKIHKDINADFVGKTTNGKIYTDFPILIQGEISKNRIEGKINDGGRLINLRTTNGNIRLLGLKEDN
ncbi:DUF4097 family beta strand repeat protein [bacterium]|nr:DUF4097 family beta strand repeat protein [bacterium]